MIIIKNDPELSILFRNERIKDFIHYFLKQLEDPYHLKEFLINGADKTMNEQLEQLSKSFYPVINSEVQKVEYFEGTLEEVERCIDGERFKVGELVYDKLHSPIANEIYGKQPIGRMYSDERGLHIQLKLSDGSITWRDLSQIEKGDNKFIV